jgi:SAM-dependent methyltransferase
MSGEERPVDQRGKEAPRWKDVWRNRHLSSSQGSTLSALLTADGFDTSYAALEEENWVAFVDRRAAELGITPGMSVFDVGCGAGAFLYDLWRRGCTVGGIDWSNNLIEIARSVMPDGHFDVKEAKDLDVHPPADVVLACAVFLYFPSHEYAREVIALMAAKANHAIALLDLPDAALEQEALDYRRALAGGEAAYAARYAGLDHRYYDRAWIAESLRDQGLVEISVADQDLADYGNGRFRFNALGVKPR